jgi:large exoprotein involved in heme utilization and adhesion
VTLTGGNYLERGAFIINLDTNGGNAILNGGITNNLISSTGTAINAIAQGGNGDTTAAAANGDGGDAQLNNGIINNTINNSGGSINAFKFNGTGSANNRGEGAGSAITPNTINGTPDPTSNFP